MCESKGLAPNVLRGVALGWGLLCLVRKRIMSGSWCQGYHIYKALWVLWMIFKVLCKIYLCIFTNLKERAETQLQWLWIRQRELTRAFLSLFSPCPSKYHTHSNGQLQGSRWGVQINTGEKWWKLGGWVENWKEDGREGWLVGKENHNVTQ